MNEIQTLIDTLTEAVEGVGVNHNTILGGMVVAVVLLLIALRANRLRHPSRSCLSALAITAVAWLTVPATAGGIVMLWVSTGGDPLQALGVSVVSFFLGFWLFRRWVRSAPRAVRRTEAVPAPVSPAVPESDLSGEVAELRTEVARLRAERQDRDGEDVAKTFRQSIH